MDKKELIKEIEASSQEKKKQLYKKETTWNKRLTSEEYNEVGRYNGLKIMFLRFKYDFANSRVKLIAYFESNTFEHLEIDLSDDALEVTNAKIKKAVEDFKKLMLDIYKQDEKVKRMGETADNLSFYEFDEFDDKVDVTKLEKALSRIDCPRELHEERPVIDLEENKIFVNAASALRFAGIDYKNGNQVYKACEKDEGQYRGRYYAYAEKADILKWIEILEVMDEK